MSACDDDVPPLEDCAEMIEKANHLRDSSNKEVSNHNTRSEIKSNQKAIIIDKTQNDTASESSKKKTDFGGMRKGFLFGGSSKPKSPPKKRLDDLPMLSPKQSREEALRIPEVQESMKDAVGFNKDWINDDLITNISKNEKLSKWLTDPRSSHILSEIQSNPTAAMAKYKDDPDVSQFFKEFGQFMGAHFDNLADQKEETEKRLAAKATQGADIRPSVDAEADRVMEDPDVRAALLDPDVQRVIQALKVDPTNGERIMRTADAKLRHHLGVLLKSGVLGVQQA